MLTCFPSILDMGKNRWHQSLPCILSLPGVWECCCLHKMSSRLGRILLPPILIIQRATPLLPCVNYSYFELCKIVREDKASRNVNLVESPLQGQSSPGLTTQTKITPGQGIQLVFLIATSSSRIIMKPQALVTGGN